MLRYLLPFAFLFACRSTPPPEPAPECRALYIEYKNYCPETSRQSYCGWKQASKIAKMAKGTSLDEAAACVKQMEALNVLKRMDRMIGK